MKNLNKFLSASFVMVLMSSATYAQNSATDQVVASATIVAPITITNTVPFDFGWLASTAGGTAILDASTGAVSQGLGTVVVVTGGASTAASFDVTGEGTNLYTITFPTAPVLLTGSVSGTMNISTFTTATATGTLGTLAAGLQTFTMGATLTINAAQATGLYTSDPFDVTVTYN